MKARHDRAHGPTDRLGRLLVGFVPQVNQLDTPTVGQRKLLKRRKHFVIKSREGILWRLAPR